MTAIDILVNGRALTRQVTGNERYFTEILVHLGDRLRIVRPTGSFQGWKGHAWEQLVLPTRVSGRKMLWSPANTGPLAVSNQVLTLHDLSPLEHPEWYRPAFALWYRLFMPPLIRRVKRVITSSEHVRRKIISRYRLADARVVAVPAGVNMEHFSRRDPPAQYGRYILFVGSIEPRKNLATLLAAWKCIEKQYPQVSLVIAGVTGSVFRQVDIPGDIARVHWPGYVPDALLPALYSGADVFVLPSFDEGFGLPVLEAMACGTPVATSTGGALPEVAGDAGMLFAPTDTAALAEILNQCLSDPELRRSMSERGRARAQQFSWETTADLVWQALREAYET